MLHTVVDRSISCYHRIIMYIIQMFKVRTINVKLTYNKEN